MAVILLVFMMTFVEIIKYGVYYYLVYIQNNTVRYVLVHTNYDTISTQVSNVVTTKMNGTENTLSTYKVSVHNVNTGAAIANSNWNDAQSSSSIIVEISGTYTPSVPLLLFLPSSFIF